MRILLTGATGFIGSHVARLLVRAGHRVHGLNLPGCGTQRLADGCEDLELIDLDLGDSDGVVSVIERIKPEACIHLAWYAEPGKYLSSPLNLDCLSQSIHLARTLIGAGCQRLLAAGTCVEYDFTCTTGPQGPGLPTPAPGSAGPCGRAALSESHPVDPQSLYAASKLALWQILEHTARLTDLSVAWLRFFYLYGPHEDERRLVPAVIRGLLNGERVALTEGSQVRDFLHVEDLAAAVVAVLDSPLSGPVNVCSGVPVSVRQIATTLGSVLGRADLLDFGARAMNSDEPPWVVGDNRKLVQGTAWRPHFDLVGGLSHTIAWWRTAGCTGSA